MQIFRLSTARMKINRIPYVIVQATSQFSFKFCIILQCHDTQFLWNVLTEILQYMLWTKRTHQCTIFQTLSALMKVHPIPYAIFQTTRLGSIQILNQCSVSWKMTPVSFLAQTSYTLDKSSPSKWNFWTFQSLGGLNFASLFNVMRDNSSVLF